MSASMSKSRSIEQTLSGLSALKGVGGATAAGELAKFLQNKSNLVAAKAADLARQSGLKSLEPQLIEAFGRFMKTPTTTDKTCAAKQAIANALYELGCDAQEVFLAGIHHVQMEPAWGGSVDTAAELRGICALGLVRMGYREVMNELVDLLADPSHQARIMAARAIAYSGRDDGALLLRLKILVGDPSDDVTVECLLALGNLVKTRALQFITKYLDSSNDALAEAAAMALGEMRHESALAILLEKWERDALPELRKPLTLPIALSRLPRSVDFLVKVVGEAPISLASAALEALRMYRHDDAIRSRIRQAVQSRKPPDLEPLFDKLFG
jgi:HEAT repeat protein